MQSNDKLKNQNRKNLEDQNKLARSPSLPEPIINLKNEMSLQS